MKKEVKKDKIVACRVNPETLQRIVALAAEENRTVANLIETILVEACKKKANTHD